MKFTFVIAGLLGVSYGALPGFDMSGLMGGMSSPSMDAPKPKAPKSHSEETLEGPGSMINIGSLGAHALGHNTASVGVTEEDAAASGTGTDSAFGLVSASPGTPFAFAGGL